MRAVRKGEKIISTAMLYSLLAKLRTVVIIISVSLTALNLESSEPTKIIEKFNHVCS